MKGTLHSPDCPQIKALMSQTSPSWASSLPGSLQVIILSRAVAD